MDTVSRPRPEIISHGTVKLTRRGRNDPSMAPSHHCSVRTGHRIPDAERSRSEQTVVTSSEQVAPHAKEVLHEPVHRQESLGVSDRFEPSHLALTMPYQLMRDLRSVVFILHRAVYD